MIPEKFFSATLLFLFCILVASMALGIKFGTVPVSVIDFFSEIFSKENPRSINSTIIHLRIPRVFLAACVGSLLAVSGLMMQALFRNPLADPSIIGVTAGASLGSSLAIFFASYVLEARTFTGQLNELILTSAGAFVGGIAAVTLVYRVVKQRNSTLSVHSMLLAGIGITSLAASATSLIDFYASSETLKKLSLWRMGSMDGANYVSLMIFVIFLGIVFVYKNKYIDSLNALLLGESQARYLGIPVNKVKLHLIVFVTLVTAVSVAVCGAITFVGLVIPHLMRLLLGANHQRLVIASIISGATLLVVADLISRTLLPPTQLPIGVVTALLGTPIFLSLLRRQTQKV